MPTEKKDWSTAVSNDTASHEYRAFVNDRDRDISAFLDFEPSRGIDLLPSAPVAERADARSLSGMPFAIKDNIAVRGFRLSCGSKILESFVAPYTATAVERLCAAGAVPVGKTNLDEFGMGSSCDSSAFARTNNPWDLTRVAGGSSGGSAAAVAAGLVPFALGTDTGGSIRQPAAFCGVYGLKPTYGAVSRYGLVAYASSLDCLGVIAADPEICRAVFAVMRGEDEHDQSTYAPEPAETESRRAGAKSGSGGAPVSRIAILRDTEGLDSAIRAAYLDAAEKYRAAGVSVTEIEFSSLKYAVPTYYTIATAEASANLARYTGIRYGNRPEYAENPEELVRKARTDGFGPEVKLRILLGTYVLRSGFQDKYYNRAQKIRTVIRTEFVDAFSEFDAVLMPVFPSPAFVHDDPERDSFRQKIGDIYTTAASLAGVPALTFPAGITRGLPIGLQLVGPEFSENLLLDAASIVATPVTFPDAFPPVYGFGR